MDTASQKKRSDRILNSIPFFSGLSEDDLLELESHIKRKRITKNEVVLFEEETTKYMYIVYSGKVRVVKINLDGREQIITIHKKKEYFGEMALLDGKTSPATVIAMEDSEIGLLGRDDFDRFIETNDNMRRNIITALCTQLREAWMMIRIMSFDNAEKRIMAVLSRMQELYGVVDNRGGIINIKLTHQQIANYASVTRETVTRVLNRLEKENIIEVLDGKCILLKNIFYERIKNIS
ncbi:MAG: Crp/Fnr family transcriptional regulator [Desulfuromonadales bacterium]|nr:Crp/Fnr family transcriptional regulator [Desulfuromonadales bacterium]